jgi:hypothetical protein
MRGLLIAIMGFIVAAPACAAAADVRADFVTKLFTSVCIPHMSDPDGVRAWAAERHLTPIEAGPARDAFAGPGKDGAAWMMTTAWGRFALSIRGDTQACAVWARVADPAEVETSFKGLVNGVKQPKIEVHVDKDTLAPTPWGQSHTLVYTLVTPGAASGFEFTMVTMERPGGAFQAAMLVTHVAVD